MAKVTRGRKRETAYAPMRRTYLLSIDRKSQPHGNLVPQDCGSWEDFDGVELTSHRINTYGMRMVRSNGRGLPGRSRDIRTNEL